MASLESAAWTRPLSLQPQAEIAILPDADALADHAAHWLCATALAKEGDFAVALSGGSTPRLLYLKLAARDDFPWDRAQWFWGDERFVPHDDPRSNYRMARETLLARARVPMANVHPVPTEGVDAAEGASLYEMTLKHFYGADVLDPARPLFDVVLLGLGVDGHLASLLPGSAALGERTRWVTSVARTASVLEPRITLTYATLESCRHAAFIVSGRDKREVLARWRQGDETLPAVHFRPAGALHVFADAEASG